MGAEDEARAARGGARSRRYGPAARLFNALVWCRPRRLRALLLVIAPLLAIQSATAGAPARVLAFGDSLTAGLGLPPGDAFPARLQAKLAQQGIAAQITNGGVSGDTTAGGVARLDWALAERPDYVLLELGANDMLRGVDPKVTRANLDAMLARITASGAQVLLFGMKSVPNWGPDYQREFDAIYPALAAKYHVMLYPFFLDGVALVAALNQADGLHPNAEGVAILVDRIAPWVEKLIAGQPRGVSG
ncbi:MAG: arylesterase [Alphaproteobacteria bacterium]|nr:arylesterase [Alphaproteobacteria bacterium]